MPANGKALRYTGLALIVVGLSLVGACGEEATGPVLADAPNIVIILVDDLRWDALSVTGHPFSQTPNIDRLAAEGMLFTDAFVVHSLCAPSRATLFTGRYSHTHGVTRNAGQINSRTPTINSLLSATGYETAFVGKWHLGGEGMLAGRFDRWLSFKGQGTYRNPIVNVDGAERQAPGHVTDVLTDYALDFVSRERDRPFLLILSHKAVHAPFTPQSRFDGRYSNATIELPPTFGEDLSTKPSFLPLRPVGDSTTLVTRIRDYHETVAGVDESVGKLLDRLQELALLDRTLVIFTSDNGYLLGEHNLTDKRVAYEESIRIPLIVRYPAWFGSGSVSDAMALNLDIASTVLDAAQVRGGYGMEGVTLRELASGDASRTSFLYEYYREPRFPVTPSIRAVRTADFKYIYYIDDDVTDELYDLRADPFETTNLVARPDFANVLAGLRAELARLRRATGDI